MLKWLGVKRSVIFFIYFICAFVAGLFGVGKELSRKMSTTRANVAKVETAVYALRVRGGEAPPTLLLPPPTPNDWENHGHHSDDEGFY